MGLSRSQNQKSASMWESVHVYCCLFVYMCCWMVCMSYGGHRTVVLTSDRLENRFPGYWHTHKDSFFSFSHYTTVWSCFFWCYLCGSRGWWPAQSRGLLGGSASGKQWSRSSGGERCTFKLSFGRWQSCKAEGTPLFFLGDWLYVMWLNTECSRGHSTLMWGVVSLLIAAAINCFSDFSSCWGRSGDPQQNGEEFDFSIIYCLHTVCTLC